MNKIKNLISKIIRQLISGEKYAKRLGVKIGNDCEIQKNVFWVLNKV